MFVVELLADSRPFFRMLAVVQQTQYSYGGRRVTFRVVQIGQNFREFVPVVLPTGGNDPAQLKNIGSGIFAVPLFNVFVGPFRILF